MYVMYRQRGNEDRIMYSLPPFQLFMSFNSRGKVMHIHIFTSDKLVIKEKPEWWWAHTGREIPWFRLGKKVKLLYNGDNSQMYNINLLKSSLIIKTVFLETYFPTLPSSWKKTASHSLSTSQTNDSLCIQLGGSVFLPHLLLNIGRERERERERERQRDRMIERAIEKKIKWLKGSEQNVVERDQ